MTHGDQAKAKAAKSSQASGSKKISSKSAGQALKSGETGKAAGKGGGQTGQIPLKKASASAGAKGVAASGSGKEGGKGRPAAAPADEGVGFSNATVAAAFERALQKYPNALRKLTD